MKIRHDHLLRLIAVFKFFKDALLIALSVGAFKLLHKNVGEIAERWVEALRLDPGSLGGRGAGEDLELESATNQEIGLDGIVYAALFFIEGTGLWLRKRWGEWVTVMITGTVMPFEVYGIHRHATWVRVGALIINLAIVVYLIYRIRAESGSRAGRPCIAILWISIRAIMCATHVSVLRQQARAV